MKRLCIYFFYDKDGIVDEYVRFYLKAMREFCSDICVVVNGKLTKKSEKLLASVSDKLIVRKNIGFDSWAYKEALESYGFEYVSKNFDEVLLNNFTCFGPIGSFKPMFDKMNKEECDFWGHCRYLPSSGEMVNNVLIPEHLMSYFVVFKKSILISKDWCEYWETLKPIKDYDEARLYHEFRLTSYFEHRGFVSCAFCNELRCYQISGANPSVHDAYYELINDKSPLLKRKIFFSKNGKYIFYSKISQYNDILYYIKKHGLYDLHLIFDNLLRTGDFCFSNKITLLKKIKWIFLGNFIGIRHYKRKLAMCPDFCFIKKELSNQISKNNTQGINK